MSHSPLHGLNVVRPETPQTQYTISDQQDLLANPPFPDFNAQLDLWTNLHFQTDEPFVRRGGRAGDDGTASPLDEDRDDEADPEGPASLEGHVNAVNPVAVPNVPAVGQQAQQQPSPFDMNTILAGFGIDPYLVPQVTAPPSSQAASLAQLLASYPLAPPSFFGQAPDTAAAPAPVPQSRPATQVKRPRSRKATVSIPATPVSASSASFDRSFSVDAESADGTDGGGLPLNAVDDKRKRNTAASARFRLKKKEREAALEKRSKELETRVNELERECEGLRRENGWLKGLVVGVTGANQGAQVGPAGTGAGSKRKRDTEEKNARAAERVGSEGKKIAVATM
ncbi:hypothetical protein DFH11DRAFT_1562001 [Phellopilus nigrolimitatus]|nr:hypothetical protein DFH11DRAFT_1562001 [Phellopilus nigrolimitatus]